jgi:hypothetical protein
MPLHGRATYTRIAENASVEIAAAGQRAASHFVGVAGGYAEPAEINASWRVLLPLFARKDARKLRKNVRDAEIRVALVGNVLREVAKPL